MARSDVADFDLHSLWLWYLTQVSSAKWKNKFFMKWPVILSIHIRVTAEQWEKGKETTDMLYVQTQAKPKTLFYAWVPSCMKMNACFVVKVSHVLDMNEDQ